MARLSWLIVQACEPFENYAILAKMACVHIRKFSQSDLKVSKTGEYAYQLHVSLHVPLAFTFHSCPRATQYKMLAM